MLSELKKARIAAKLSLDDVSRQLNIRKKYLIALEENNLSAIPGDAYISGYLKLYTKFLKLDPEKFKPEIVDINSKPHKASITQPIHTEPLEVVNDDKYIESSDILPNKNNKNLYNTKSYIIIGSLLLLLMIIMLYPYIKQ